MDEGKFVNVLRPAGGGPYACPCCGYLTLDERGGYEICPVCFWEDDGQDDHDADRVRGGPNRGLSLAQARRNFAALGASDERRQRFVRPPTDEEHPLRQAARRPYAPGG
ncbi:CPCC family cysteine-rich protein [Actinoplanes sp. NPDC049681]|uniref:CPCC family cysteine-rich protein n=1 Tax=Actinoplanes sp. NPDC049681 TaxID=3363905 RepID=UPI0037879AF6